MKKLLMACGVVVVLLIVAVVALLIKLDPEALGEEVLRRVNATEGTQLEAQRFSLHVLKGLELEQAHATTELAAGPLEVGLERLLLEHRLAPLLKGQVVVDKVLLEKPQIEWITRAEPEAEAAEPVPEPAPKTSEQSGEAEKRGLTVAVSEIRIREGSLTVRTMGSQDPGLTVSGFNLDLLDARLDPSACFPRFLLLQLARRATVEYDRTFGQ